ncbi:MAG: hypothetical protein AAB486_02840 [Patescibacteria group bacterium]
MKKCVLITRPRHDFTTNCLYYWSSIVIEKATKKGFTVLDLGEKKANKLDFDSYIKKNTPKLVFFNGHGNENTITGNDNEALVRTDKDEGLLSGKVIYARSCNAASIFGESCVKNGTIAFIGYKDKFSFASSSGKATRPLQDGLIKLFLEPSNLIPISLIKGNTVSKAYRKSQEGMLRNLRSMISSQSSLEQRSVAFLLWKNIQSQVLIGDDQAVV